MENHNFFGLPVGFRFRPTDEELIRYYLLRKVFGLPLPLAVVQDCDLYGNKEPWEIWDEFSAYVTDYASENGMERRERSLYFFTRLKKKSETDRRYERKVGNGSWHGETKACPVGDCGVKKMFTYERKNAEDGVRNNEFHWRMHEFSLNPEGFSPRLPEVEKNDYVLCRIIRDIKKRKAEAEQLELAGSTANRFPRLPENGLPPESRFSVAIVPVVQQQNWSTEAPPPVPDLGNKSHQH